MVAIVPDTGFMRWRSAVPVELTIDIVPDTVFEINKSASPVLDVTAMVPFTVSVGSDTYPPLPSVFEELEAKTDLYKVDALKIARDAGAAITKNTVMLGTLAATKVLPFEDKILLDTILETVPAKFKSINEKAFQGGIEAVLSR